MARGDLQTERARLDSEVSGYVERIAGVREALRLSEAARAQAEAEKEKAAENPKRFQELADTARRHVEEMERLTLLAVRYEDELADRQEELERVEFELAVAERDRLQAAAAKQGARLAEILTAAAEQGGKFAKASEALSAANAQARERRPADADFETAAVDLELPESLAELLELLEEERERQSRARTVVAAAERSRRERESTRRHDLIARYNHTGDPEILAQLDEAGQTVARRQHALVRRQHEHTVAGILEKLREGRFGPAEAQRHLARMSGIPDDLRAEAARTIESLASRRDVALT